MPTGSFHRRLFGLARLALFLLVLPFCADGYQRAGHYYSMNFSYRDLLQQSSINTSGPSFSKDDVRVFAFCTQLPDQSSDLDAVSVYAHAMLHTPFSWVKWALANHTDSEAILKMVLVQRLLHGLTGGDAGAVQKVAKANVSQLAAAVATTDKADHNAALCALGFAMHLYGDSYAHVQMSPDNPKAAPRMYPTGRGHFADMHYPDYPLCAAFAPPPRIFRHCTLSKEQRYEKWAQYLNGVYAATYPTTQTPIAYSGAIDKVVGDIYTKATHDASDGDDWDESEIQGSLSSPNERAPLEQFFEQHRSSEPCAVVLTAAFQSGGNTQGGIPPGPLRGLQHFSCDTAWEKYARVAKKNFEGQATNMPVNPRWSSNPLSVKDETTPFWLSQ